MDKISVTVDSREPTEVARDFFHHENVEDVDIEELETGDIIIGSAIIERKTPTDFVSSVKDRRVFSQAHALSESGYHPLILIEGDMGDFHEFGHTGFSPSASRGAMASIVARTGVPVIPCGNGLSLADFAVRVGRKTVEQQSVAFSQKEFDTHKNVNPTIQMYAAIPGIGPGRAEVLYDHYPAPVLLCEATRENIEGLDGFGTKTAENVIQALQGQL